MKNKAIITFLSEQQYENDNDKSSLSAEGTLTKTDKGFVIEYTEPDEEMGKSKTVIKVVRENLVYMNRTGLYQSQFIMEHGKAHKCIYKTPFGEMDMELFAHRVSAVVSENCGKIELSYSLKNGTQIIGENSLIMEIKAIN